MSGEPIKPGYKRTEVGVIPEDWEVKRISDLAIVSSGGTPSRENSAYWNGSIPWVTTSQINFNTIEEADQFITELGLKNSAAKLLPAGTLLMALYGQGKTRGKVGVLGFEAATNQACASISPDENVSSEFLLHFLASRYEFIRNSSNTGSQENLNGQIVKDTPVVFPPHLEQRVIATALSDVDALLAKLDQLIAKKRDLKQAAMQQLLTGQTRLPGFSGEWEVKRLGDVLVFKNNGTFARADLMSQGSIKYLHYGDIHGSSGVFLDATATQMPYLPEDKARNLDQLEDGDLVFADASEDYDGIGKSIEIKNIGAENLVAGLHTIAVRFQKSALTDGFKAYLQFIPSFRAHLLRLASGTKVYATQRGHIASAELKLPPIGEQTAIAAVLSDMDAELTALEARRDKTRALKQGLMQELLTGRIRLV